MSVSVGLADPRVLSVSYTANRAGRSEPTGSSLVTACLKSLSLCPTPFNTRFFSDANIEVLQQTFRQRIKAKLGFVIDRQDVDSLCVIMRAAMRTYGREPISSDEAVIRQQVAALNDIVVQMALPQIASGAVGYLNYLRDASQLPGGLPLPQSTSTAGTKNLPIFPGI